MKNKNYSLLSILFAAVMGACLTLVAVTVIPDLTASTTSITQSTNQEEESSLSSTATYTTSDDKKMTLTIEFNPLTEGGNVVFFDLNEDGLIEPGDGWGCAAPDDDLSHETRIAGILQGEST